MGNTTNMLTFTKILLLVAISYTIAAQPSIDDVVPEGSVRGLNFLAAKTEAQGLMCDSCDAVPCGYCQPGCESSPCKPEAGTQAELGYKPKPTATTRNGCGKDTSYYPPKCNVHCPTCSQVPCGYCQQGCLNSPVAKCSADSNGYSPLDRSRDPNSQTEAVGLDTKNQCADNNAGEVPPGCNLRCDSCDAVPCGYCQEGCPQTDCFPESGTQAELGYKPKPDARTRNGCETKHDVPNWNQTPPKCNVHCECAKVPTGWCQEGCSPSTKDSGLDGSSGEDRNRDPNSQDEPVGLRSKNQCETKQTAILFGKSILNAGQVPPGCNAVASGY